MLKDIGVTQVTIPLPFRLDHVQCFLAEGEKGWTIIDTGLNTPTTRETWQPIIEKHAIKNIVITHYHPDHFGFAGTLQQLTGAEVWMTEVDEATGLSLWEPASLERTKRNYKACGLPDDTVHELTSDEGSFKERVQPYPIVNHYLEEGAKIKFGNYDYEVIYTPGHSDGLISLFNKDKSILFSTDHILPKISPNISYWFRGLDNPLKSFFTSLKKIQVLDAEYVIPSHGQPFKNANKRIEELLQHHEERLGKVYQFIKQPATIYETCNLLFKGLNTHEMRFGIGETIAHLEYLYHDFQCEKYMENGTWYYQAI